MPDQSLQATAAVELPAARKDRVKRPIEQRKQIKRHIPELLRLEKLIHRHQDRISLNTEHEVTVDQLSLPLYSITLGQQDRPVPTLFILAGVHGIERIGSQVSLALLHTLLERLQWDGALQGMLESMQIVFVPILNPGGMYLNTRSNPNGVDLNRNSPVQSEEPVSLLVGGQRISKHLPWFRGKSGAPMEAENRALERLIERCMANRPFALALDIHSGFGLHDQIWFPYAYRREPMQDIHQYMALKLLWDRTYPNHRYVFEPQSANYLTHGDLWDYFYLKLHRQPGIFLPLTLEMGSWSWIRKRPRQLFSYSGLFNPEVQHRQSRTLRRHLSLFDFLLSATFNYRNWLPENDQQPNLRQMALHRWYTSAQ